MCCCLWGLCAMCREECGLAPDDGHAATAYINQRNRAFCAGVLLVILVQFVLFLLLGSAALTAAGLLDAIVSFKMSHP